MYTSHCSFTSLLCLMSCLKKFQKEGDKIGYSKSWKTRDKNKSSTNLKQKYDNWTNSGHRQKLDKTRVPCIVMEHQNCKKANWITERGAPSLLVQFGAITRYFLCTNAHFDLMTAVKWIKRENGSGTEARHSSGSLGLYAGDWHPLPSPAQLSLCTGVEVFLRSKVLCAFFWNLHSLSSPLSPLWYKFQNETDTEPLT